MRHLDWCAGRKVLGAAVSAGLLTAAVARVQADITWTAAGGGNWSDGTNWSGGIAPKSGDTAALGSTSANRTVIYDSSASGSLGTLTMTQSAAYQNVLDIQKNLTITNAASIGASGGGTTFIVIDPHTTTGSTVVTLKLPKLTLGAGSALELTGYFTDTTNYTVNTSLDGDVSIEGGNLYVDSSTVLKSNPFNAVTDTVTGKLNMTSGSLVVGATAQQSTMASSLVGTGNYVRGSVQRLQINGNLTVSGGSILNGSGKTASLFLYGATNSVTGLSSSLSSANVDVALVAAGAQSYMTDSALGNLILRNLNGTVATPSVKTLGSTIAGGTLNIGAINMVNGVNNSTTSLQLASNITLTGGAAPTLSGAGSGTTVIFGVDTNGYTFDVTSVASGWSLTNISGNSNVNWSLTNSNPNASTNVGTIKATSFDLSGASSVAVGPYVNLQATGGGGTINTLSNAGAGTISAQSIFTYAGNATTANYAKLVSTRTIGGLKVQSGALQLGSAITTGAAVTVNNGATLDLGGNTLTSSNMQVQGTLSGNGVVNAALMATGKIAPGAAGMILNGTLDVAGSGAIGTLNVDGGTLTLGGTTTSLLDIGSDSSFDAITLTGGAAINFNASTLSLNFLYSPVDTAQYALFSGGTGIGDFSSVTSNLSSSQYTLDFNAATGILTVSTVPEPATFGVLALAAGGLLMKRKR